MSDPQRDADSAGQRAPGSFADVSIDALLDQAARLVEETVGEVGAEPGRSAGGPVAVERPPRGTEVVEQQLADVTQLVAEANREAVDFAIAGATEEAEAMAAATSAAATPATAAAVAAPTEAASASVATEPAADGSTAAISPAIDPPDGSISTEPPSAAVTDTAGTASGDASGSEAAAAAASDGANAATANASDLAAVTGESSNAPASVESAEESVSAAPIGMAARAGRLIGAMLSVLNAPFNWLGEGVRHWAGLTAIATLGVSLLLWLAPLFGSISRHK